MWLIIDAGVILLGILFVHFFGNWSIKQGWYDDIQDADTKTGEK